MKKLLIITIVLLGLTACENDNVMFRDKLILIKPPEQFYECNLAELPRPATLTEIQVARYIVRQYQFQKICQNNMKAIKEFLDRAETRLKKSRA